MVKAGLESYERVLYVTLVADRSKLSIYVFSGFWWPVGAKWLLGRTIIIRHFPGRSCIFSKTVSFTIHKDGVSSLYIIAACRHGGATAHSTTRTRFSGKRHPRCAVTAQTWSASRAIMCPAWKAGWWDVKTYSQSQPNFYLCQCSWVYKQLLPLAIMNVTNSLCRCQVQFWMTVGFHLTMSCKPQYL